MTRARQAREAVAEEDRCGECGHRITRGPTGIEYGHARGIRGGEGRCPKRPPAHLVDPVKNGNPNPTDPPNA